MEWFKLGARFTERGLFGGNRSGKTVAGGFEMVMHLTGEYPDWWEGKRFDHPIEAWVSGDTGKNTRDINQFLLCGKPGIPEELGRGLIPADCIIRTTPKHGIPDAFETVYVRHKPTGGVSTVQFKSYDQGRVAFQGAAVHVIWLDEEPPEDVYTECLLRLMTTDGIIMLTATPLQGLTKLMLLFLPGLAPADDVEEQKRAGQGKIAVMVSWEDVPHLSEAQKKKILAGIPHWQRKSRTTGAPALGPGAIFQIAEEDVVIQPIPIPDHWPRGYALDVGWNRTACLWGARDPETGVTYIYDEYYVGHAEPSVHAGGIKARGDWIHGVIDPASRGRAQKDGERLFELYENLGLHVELAKNGVESGIYMVWEALSQGTLKVFTTCQNFRKEYRIYRRDDKGKVVKENDHLMDCVRYLIQSDPLTYFQLKPSTRLGRRWCDVAVTPWTG